MNRLLIVGLGNPGGEYENTRHNIGFNVLDALAKASSAVFAPSRYAEITEVKHKGRTLILVKPNTFMNLSGKAVAYWLQQEKIHAENLLVITDDLAIPFGTLRLRGKGSDGGHNGLKNIIYTLNSSEFSRLRFGIGSNFEKGQQVNYVLNTWLPEEENRLAERIDIAVEIVLSFATIGLSRTMSAFNRK